jgi:isopentenyl-diphosphate delta-isomerase
LTSDETEIRKIDHIKICLERNVESYEPSGFNDISLVHDCLPDLNFNNIDVSIEILGKKIEAPIIIEPITGGSKYTLNINRNLAEVAEDLNIGISIGSQRAALENPNIEYTYKVVRESAPSTLVFANIGCAQLLHDNLIEIAETVVDMVDADGLTIHLNPLQESIQPEGDINLKGVLAQIGELTKKLKVPVMIKETGAGISKEAAVKLENQGVKIVDIAGLGGTTWAGVEYYRALGVRDSSRVSLGNLFWDWGLPTAISLVEVLHFTSMKVIASGGIRNGLDVAKALALGADAGGLALPLLKAAVKSRKTLLKYLKTVIQELKLALFLTGSKDVLSLQSKPVIISGKTADWLTKRGVNINHYAMR